MLKTDRNKKYPRQSMYNRLPEVSFLLKNAKKRLLIMMVDQQALYLVYVKREKDKLLPWS